MSSTRSLRALLVPIALLTVAAAGCGSKDSSSAGAPVQATTVAAPSGSASPTEASSSAPATAASTTAPPTTAAATPTGADCAAGAKAIPPGRWSGPIVLKVTGTVGAEGGGIETTTKQPSTMSVTVRAGKVRGTWQVNWDSAGTVSASGVSASVKATGNIHGAVSMSPATPQLDGDWSLKGTATVSGAGDVPLTVSGSDTEKLTIVSVTCDTVVATFIPSFNTGSAAAAGALFQGTATWTGTKQG